VNTIINETLNEFIFAINNLHFLRADWFYAFIPLALYLVFSYNKTQSRKNWQSVIDPKLQPYVLRKSSNKQRRYPLLLAFIAASLCITALAGPVYKQLPQPVYREQSSLVVLLDLSQSMNAADIKPSRLSRAKLELLDILKTRKTGQTALIVYAADAFIVTPLTDDNATIANLVPSLETDMMPAQGSNFSSALAKTVSLFSQAGIIKGDILAITDDIRENDKHAIEKITSQGHRLSIFGIGTTEGGPVPLDGGFLLDNNGAIVIPKLNPAKLQNYALSGGGLYTSLQADDSDINKLSRLFQSSETVQDISDKDRNADIWQEEGHWLLLPLLFFAALWSRKGWLAVLILFILPVPQPAYAEDINTTKTTLDTKHLWSSPDQKAMKAFNSGDNETAAEQFTQPDWKASAYYRKGDYQAAANELQSTSSSDGFYNKGNALAKLGRYDESIKAYDKAIELNENNSDAKYNREQVKNALEKQQNSENNDTQQDSSDQENSEQENSQQQDQQSKEGEKQDSQQQDSESQQPSDQSTEENKTNQKEQQPSMKDSTEQKQAEDQQLKQRDAEKESEQQQQEKDQYEKDAEKNNAEKNSDEIENIESENKPEEIEVNPMEASITEQEKATEQWLKRIPDDPGGLLRRKFLYQYKNIPDQQDSNEPW